jgi:hypothetical protein
MAQKEQDFKPDFENGGFWEYYKDLERQFESFLEYVPYLKGNENTYSFRLANILLAIGAHIDSALKKIAEDPSFSTKYPKMINPTGKNPKTNEEEPRLQNINDFYPLSEEYKLYEKVVSFKRLPDREPITPFEEYRKEIGKVPYWWTAYNKVKHHFTENFKEKANLKTVRDALAGAFLINVIFEPATIRLAEYGLVKFKFSRYGHCEKQLTFSRGSCSQFKGLIEPDYAFDCLIETPIFMYEYKYERNEKP